jgi:AraC family transcriptional regulator
MRQADRRLLKPGSYLGTSFRRRGRFAMWTANGVPPAPLEHVHQEAHFMFILNGPYDSRATGEARPAGPILIFNPAGTVHADRLLSGRGTFFSLGIEASALSDEPFGLAQTPVHVPQPAAEMLMWEMARNCCSPDASRLQAECITHELVAFASRKVARDRGEPKWLARACELLEEHPGDLSINELGATVGAHPVYVARSFRRFRNCTPAEFRTRVRIKRALQLLNCSRPDLSEIAVACGFFDQSHFSRSFRQTVGVSPGAYRKLAG